MNDPKLLSDNKSKHSRKEAHLPHREEATDGVCPPNPEPRIRGATSYVT